MLFDEVLKIQAEAESLLAGNEHEVDSRRMLELVRDSNCSAHDCEFIALAVRLGTKVVTMDGKMSESFRSTRCLFTRLNIGMYGCKTLTTGQTGKPGGDSQDIY